MIKLQEFMIMKIQKQNESNSFNGISARSEELFPTLEHIVSKEKKEGKI